MSTEYTEYKGRHTQNYRRKKNTKNSTYFKKLLKQTLISITIFSVVLSPEFLGLDYGTKIKSITKSALFYTIDMQIFDKALKHIYPHKGEIDNAEEASVTKDI